MKKLAQALSAFALCLVTLPALCQSKSDFSDWNVPPPIPPGTIPRSAPVKPPANNLPADVEAPSTIDIFNLKLAALSAVSQTAPDVEAPDQPDFPAMPFVTVEIPLPKIPAAVGLPKQTMQDQLTETYTDMPEPAVPEMPDVPKRPDEPLSKEGTDNVKMLLTPEIITQPAQASLSTSNAFPFIEWPTPAIPQSVDFNAVPTEKTELKKIMPKKEPAKKRRGG